MKHSISSHSLFAHLSVATPNFMSYKLDNKKLLHSNKAFIVQVICIEHMPTNIFGSPVIAI